MLIGMNGFGDPDLLVAALADHTAHPMATYSEDDDSATQVVEALAGEPKWIVQITPLDRRMMTSEELVAELERGSLIGQETLVWRGGMSDWLPVARVEGLPVVARRGAAPSADLARSSRRGTSELVLASSALAVAVLAASATVYALTKAGAFDAGKEEHVRRAATAESPLAP
jgi:predicted nucleic acid-binding protein